MFKTDLYVQILENRICVTNLATGQEAQRPFAHPHALPGNFAEALAAVKGAVGAVKGSGLFHSVRMVVHPMTPPSGALTPTENRALRELAIGAGAAKVVVWVGEALSGEAARVKLQAA